MKIRSISTAAILTAELSHLLCCGLPIFIAVMSAGSQVGLGGGFALFHSMIHHHEFEILIGSGIILSIGLFLHYISHQINCHSTHCKSAHGDCAPKKFRVGWIFAISFLLYAFNLTFYILSDHGAQLHKFT